MTQTQQPEAPPTEVVYGIAKKMSLELDKLALHTHGAVISMMTTMAKHREATLRQEQEAKMQDAQDAAMKDAVKAHADAQVKREAQLAAEMIRANANRDKQDAEAKAPRLSIMLDGGKQVDDVGQMDAGLPAGPNNPVAEAVTV